MRSVVIILDRRGDRLVHVIESGYRSAEDIAVLQDFVDGFDHAVGERDIDTGDELADGRGRQEGFDDTVVVLASAINGTVLESEDGGVHVPGLVRERGCKASAFTRTVYVLSRSEAERRHA
jgi:hypothetical protein